jgi:hypothetical protein
MHTSAAFEMLMRNIFHFEKVAVYGDALKLYRIRCYKILISFHGPRNPALGAKPTPCANCVATKRATKIDFFMKSMLPALLPPIHLMRYELSNANRTF